MRFILFGLWDKRKNVQLEFSLMLQDLNVFTSFNSNSWTADIRRGQKQLVHRPKLRGPRNSMFCSVFIYLDTERKVDFVEADARFQVLTACGCAHGEQGTLAHGWHREDSQVTLWAGTDSPCAIRMILFEQVVDCVPISDWRFLLEECCVVSRVLITYKNSLRRRRSYYSVTALQ